MSALLCRLGIPADIQSFFGVSEPLIFDYGDAREHFTADFHRVPVTAKIWLTGNFAAQELIVAHSVMEAMAYLSVCRTKYRRLSDLAFVATGTKVMRSHIAWIRSKFPGRRTTLVFGRDLLGNLNDIKIAAGIRGIALNMEHSNGKILIRKGNIIRVFDEDSVSYHNFQIAFGVRANIKTKKPHHATNFLEQLKNDNFP